MTTETQREGEVEDEPLWLAIEKKISTLGSHHLVQDRLEEAIQDVAKALDDDGFAVSKNAGHMMALRRSVRERMFVGRPLMEDLAKALGALTLEGLASPFVATVGLIEQLGDDWPALRESERRPTLLGMVERIKLELLVAKAKDLDGDGGIRLLIGEGIPSEVIVTEMEIEPNEFDRVMGEVMAEQAERARVAGLLEGVAGQERIRHLITNDVSDELIIEMAAVDQEAIDGVKRAMEEEIAERQRLAEEAAAKKAAEAAGPALEDISPDEMLDHIEAIREILEFSDVEKEIRVMCEQSGIPAALTDIAVSDPDKLDELEAQAEG